ncbi:MAG: C-GCAxxG-C-C family protein [Candidatus Bathyarchaeia archaeon]
MESSVVNEADWAVRLCGSGFNCAEAVLTVLSRRMEKLGKTCSDGVIPCVATGFGAGIGRQGGTCGALSGVVLALGLMAKHDKAEDFDTKYKVYDMVERLIEDFEGKFGSSFCRDLIGLDMRVKEDRLSYRSQRVYDKVCSRFVRWCVDRGAQLMDQLREG